MRASEATRIYPLWSVHFQHGSPARQRQQQHRVRIRVTRLSLPRLSLSRMPVFFQRVVR